MLLDFDILVPESNQPLLLKRDFQSHDLLSLHCLDQYVIECSLDLQRGLSEHAFDVILRDKEVLDAVLFAVAGNVQDQVPTLRIV